MLPSTFQSRSWKHQLYVCFKLCKEFNTLTSNPDLNTDAKNYWKYFGNPCEFGSPGPLVWTAKCSLILGGKGDQKQLQTKEELKCNTCKCKSMFWRTALELRLSTVPIASNESRHSCTRTGLDVHQKKKRNQKISCSFGTQRHSLYQQTYPKTPQSTYHTFGSLACHILIVQSLGQSQWNCRFFPKQVWPRVPIPRLWPRYEVFQTQLCLCSGAGEECYNSLSYMPGWECYSHGGDPCSAVHPATANAEVICEPLSPRPASNQALSPPTVGKVKSLLGHLRRLCKNIGGLSALARLSLNPLSRVNVHSLRGNLACSCAQTN